MTQKKAKSKTAKRWMRRKSKLHGYGLFAARSIAAGTRVLEYKGEKITKKESEARALIAEQKANKNANKGRVYIFELNARYDIDGDTPENPARYINHACDENCEAVMDGSRIYIQALRDICEGEELFYDYGYPLQSALEHPCKCGTPNCLGYIVTRSDRPKLRRLLRRKTKVV